MNTPLPKLTLFPIRRIYALVVVSLATTLTTALVFAQPSGEIESELDEDEEIIILPSFFVDSPEDTGYISTNSITATGFQAPTYKVPLNISALTEDFFDDAGILEFSEATSYISGVSSNVENRAINGTEFIVRGFQTSWNLRNGIRRYVVSGTDNTQRLEVIKGPAAVFFGQASPGGVINYVTKRPSSLRETTLEVSYGTYDYKRAEFGTQGPVGKLDWLDYRVNTSYLDRGGWRDFEFQRRWFTYGGLRIRPTDKLQVFLEYEYMFDKSNIANGVPRGIRQYYLDYNNPRPEQIAWAQTQTAGDPVQYLRQRWFVIDPNTNTNNQAPFRNWQADTVAAGLPPEEDTRDQEPIPEATPYGWEYNSNGPGGRVEWQFITALAELNFELSPNLSLRAYFISDVSDREYHWNVRDRAVPGDFVFDPTTFTSTYSSGSRLAVEYSPSQGGGDLGGLYNESSQGAVEVLANFHTGPVFNKILLGASEYIDEFSSETRLDEAPLPDPSIPGDQAFLPFGPPLFFKTTSGWRPFTEPYFDISRYYTDEKRRVLQQDNSREALYLNWIGEIFLPLDMELTTLFGIRKEKYVQRNIAPDGSEIGRDNNEAEIPSYGFVLELFPGFAVFASKSESYQPFAGRRVDGPVDQLTPEELSEPSFNQTGEGWDAGFKFNTKDSIFVGTVSVFEVRRGGVAQQDQAATDADPRPGVTINEQIGETMARGLEADFVFTPLESVQLLTAITWMWKAEVTESGPAGGFSSQPLMAGDPLQNTPDFEFSMWAKYSFLDGWLDGFSVGGGFRFRNPFYASTGGPFQQDESTVVDALLAYNTKLLGLDTRFALNVNNVFDERYIASGTNRPGNAISARFTVTTTY